jgi:hypothetical protein
MIREAWFSARLRFAILIETQGLAQYSDSVYVFRSSDFETAFQKALEIGRAGERAYANGAGQRVEWKLAEVISIDIVRADSLDGAEVYSEPVWGSDPSLSLEHEFHPELSMPNQTV